MPIRDAAPAGLAEVAAEARRLLGEQAPAWMAAGNRHLDHLTPAALARSPEGARILLAKLRRESRLRLAMLMRQAAARPR